MQKKVINTKTHKKKTRVKSQQPYGTSPEPGIKDHTHQNNQAKHYAKRHISNGKRERKRAN
jgi:hypothetical protein